MEHNSLDKYSLSEILDYKFQQLLSQLNCKSNNHNLYEILLNIFEESLLKIVYEHSGRNQKKAAEILGINRNTLKKKLVKYNLF